MIGGTFIQGQPTNLIFCRSNFMIQFQRWLPRCLEKAEVVCLSAPGDWHKPLYFRVNKPAIVINGTVRYYDVPNLWVTAATQLASAIREHFGHFYSDIDYQDNPDYLAAVVTLGRVYQVARLPEPEDDDDWW